MSKDEAKEDAPLDFFNAWREHLLSRPDIRLLVVTHHNHGAPPINVLLDTRGIIH